MSRRRADRPEFKTRVALVAISGRQTIQEIAADHSIHPSQVSQCMWQLLDSPSELSTRGKDTGDSQAKEVEPFQQIGRLRWSWS